MGNLYALRTVKTHKGMTAKKLIEKAKVIETQSGDFLVYADLGGVYAHLMTTDSGDMAVSYYGTSVCCMDLCTEELEALEKLEAECEARYASAS